MSSRLNRGLLVAALAALAYAVVPVSRQPNTVLVPGVTQLDAMQSTLLIADGVDRLTTHPSTYYDTTILYPDRVQRRGLEPFLGFALAGVPLRSLFGWNDTAIFEALRWTVVVVTMVYGAWLLRRLELPLSIAAVGGAMCGTVALVLHGVERLHILSIPLVVAPLAHAMALWQRERLTPRAQWGHAAALGLWVAAYPLLGLINAVVMTAALIMLAPLLGRLGWQLHREGRAWRLVMPIAIGGAVAGAAIWPWATARGDLASYAAPAFLAIKHWNGLEWPAATRDDIWNFIVTRVGLPLATAIVCAALSAGLQPTKIRAPKYWYFWGIFVAVLLAEWGGWGAWVYQLTCLMAFAHFWFDQARMPLTLAIDDVRHAAIFMFVGIGTFLVVLSFGPAVASNPNPLASWWARGLIAIVPPIASIREFDRISAFGTLFLGLGLMVYVGDRARTRRVQMVTTVLVVVAIAAAIETRPLGATDPIVPQTELTAPLAHSTARGAVYVHPLMRWDAKSCVLMMDTARAVHRPFVNGCLGLIPPYFPSATRALHSYPSAEAVWLLRTWHVATIVDLTGDAAAAVPRGVTLAYGDADARVWELHDDPGGLPAHPSAVPNGNDDAIEHETPLAWREEPDGSVIASIPAGTSASAIDVRLSMQQFASRPMPSAIVVSDPADDTHQAMNDGDSGAWLDSLAAVALIKKQSPVARIRLRHPLRGDIRLTFTGTEHAPVDRIALAAVAK